MSVMQVVGSSRISNTTYLAVSSIYWTLFLTTTNITLNLDIQTSLLIITPAAGIASLLWVARIEEVLVSWILLNRFPSSQSGRFIRYHMGHSTLHIQPWKEAIESRPSSVEESLRDEAKRVLRSPFLKEEMETLYQLFWLLTSIPALLVLLGISQQTSTGGLLVLIALSVLVDLLLIIVIVIRKRAWTLRVLGYAYCSWVTDLLRNISRRRESFSKSENKYFPLRSPHFFPQRDSDAGYFITRIGPWIEEMTSLAFREDWNGFERNLENFLNSQDIAYKQEKRSKLLDSLVSDVIWSFKRRNALGPYPGEEVTISYDQAFPVFYLGTVKAIVLDAIEETQVLEPTHLKTDRETTEKRFLSDWASLATWENIYSILPLTVMSELSYRAVQALAELPFFMDDASFELEKLYQIRGTQRLWILDLVHLLHMAVDRGLISPMTVFVASTQWNVMPNQYIEKCSPKIRPLILEVETEMPAAELKLVARKVITDSRNIDANKVASNLARFRGDPEFDEIVGIIRGVTLSNPGKPHALKAKEILANLGEDEI